jgi:hypothetical protein
MHKIMLLISKKIPTKIMFPFIGWIWWKNKSYQISKAWNFEPKDYKAKDFFFTIWLVVYIH